MAKQGTSREMQVKIVGCRLFHVGTTGAGTRFELWDVDAENMQGELIRHKLRAFEELPQGVQTVTVTAFDSERHGKSYTLHAKGGRTGPEDDPALVKRVQTLEQELAALKELVGPALKVYQERQGFEDAATAPPDQPTNNW